MPSKSARRGPDRGDEDFIIAKSALAVTAPHMTAEQLASLADYVADLSKARQTLKAEGRTSARR